MFSASSCRRILLALAVAALIVGGIFAAWPAIDLRVAALFVQENGFVERGGLAGVGRWLGFYLPFILLAGSVLLWSGRRIGLIARAPSGRAVLFLLGTIALGPGLLTNVFLKDHSHRPRPAQVQDFGGQAEFRPFWRWDGACVKNCSFVSGEASGAFWTLAPALLTPPPVRPFAVGLSVLFGTIVGALRMAFGGHFLSDVIFAGLFTAMVVMAGAGLLLRRRG